LNYFSESPYATWTVLADKAELRHLIKQYNLPDPRNIGTDIRKDAAVLPADAGGHLPVPQQHVPGTNIAYPFAFVEFLHIKYDKVFLVQEYYMIFIVLALLCILYKAQTIRRQSIFENRGTAVFTLAQLYTATYLCATRPSPKSSIYYRIV